MKFIKITEEKELLSFVGQKFYDSKVSIKILTGHHDLVDFDLATNKVKWTNYNLSGRIVNTHYMVNKPLVNDFLAGRYVFEDKTSENYEVY